MKKMQKMNEDQKKRKLTDKSFRFDREVKRLLSSVQSKSLRDEQKRIFIMAQVHESQTKQKRGANNKDTDSD